MDPADPERPPTAEGGASGAEKGKKRDEIASISSNEPSGGTQVETDGLKGGGVEHDDGDGGDASPESASPKKKSLGSKLEDLAFSISRDSLPSRYVAERGEMEGREGP